MIFLWLLKILALTLVCLLALAFLLFLLVVSAPIIYRLKAGYAGKPDIRFNAKWILRIFTVNYDTSNTPAFTIRICGRAKHKLKKAKPVSEKGKSSNSKKRNNDPETDAGEDKKKVSLIDNVKKAGEAWDKFTDYPYKRRLVNQTILLVKRLIKGILPREIAGECCFGFDDPSLTGMLLGAAHALLGAAHLYNKIYVNADFEKEYLYLKCQSAGKIRLWSILWPLIAYAVSKPVWIILKPLVFKKQAKG